MKPFTTNLSKKKISDAGMAFVLLELLLGYFLRNDLFYIIAIIALLTNMIFPLIFYPFALVWYAFSIIIGHIISAFLLSLIFIVLVIPFGIVRKMMGKTKSIFPAFSKGNKSIMHLRMHTFTSADLSRPF